MAKRVIVSKKAQVAPNGSITGANNILYNDYNAVDDLYNSLAEYFTVGKVSGTSHLSKIIQKDFDSIEKQVGKVPTNLNHLKDLMGIVKEVKDYQDTKKATDVDFMTYQIRKQLFAWQKEVVDSPKKRIAMLCGRRSGKSFVDAAIMLIHSLVGADTIEVDGRIISKHRKSYYIGLTIGKAATVMWQQLKDLIEKTRIPVKKIDNSSCTIEFANGATIALGGNSSKAEREKYRGEDGSLYIIDECQSQIGLSYLINDILNPIIKGRNGLLILSGTAPIYAGGYWEQIINDDSYLHIHATMEDNPSIANNSLATVLEENGWTEDNITFRREYKAEIAYDSNRMMFPLRSYYNIEDLQGRIFDRAVIGIDFGFSDDSAWAPIIHDKLSDRWFLIEEYMKNGMSSDNVVAKTFEIESVLRTVYRIDDIHIVGDTNEQIILQEMKNKRPELDITTAYKPNEVQQTADLNEALQSGHLNILKQNIFDSECDKLLWQWDDEKRVVIYKMDDAVFHGNMCDAVRYAYKYSRELI